MKQDFEGLKLKNSTKHPKVFKMPNESISMD
jgi:hypothetical protein